MKDSFRNRIVHVMFFIVLAVLLSTTVFAIGVTPSKRVVQFRPGETLTYGIDIINNGGEDLEVTVYPRGGLKDRVKLSRQLIRLSSGEDSAHVNVDFSMPGRIDVAGPHEIDIVAVGSSSGPEGKEAVVKADLAVISKLVVEVPYPDRYAEARIHVLDTEAGRPVQFNVPVFNKGSVDLGEVFVRIEVFDSQGEKVDSIRTGKQAIASGSDTKFAVKAGREYFTGDYTAVATVFYDGQEIEVRTGFSVGELAIDITNLVVDEFSLGDVARFDILLHNTWSQEMKNVYAEMEVVGNDNTVYTDFKTVAIDIPARGVGALEGYWHTRGVEPGVYTAKVILHYANRVSQKEFELEVYANRIVTRSMRTGKAIEAPEELDLEKNMFLILVILVLAAAVVALVFKLRKKGSKQEEVEEKKEVKKEMKTVRPSVSQEQIETLQMQLDALKRQAGSGDRSAGAGMPERPGKPMSPDEGVSDGNSGTVADKER